MTSLAGAVLTAVFATGACGTPPVASAHTASGRDVAPPPPSFVAVRDGTLVVLVDTRTGRDLLVLYRHTPWRPESRIDGVARSPDGSTVYVSVDGTMFRLRSEGGGHPDYLGSGSHPAVSADGRFLAYDLADGLVARSLADGSERRWWQGEAGTGPPLYGGGPAWSPDNRTV